MDHLLDGQWCYWNHDGEPRASSSVDDALGGMGLPSGVQVLSNGKVAAVAPAATTAGTVAATSAE